MASSGRTAVASIRNFSIISHVDHGKSTLSDRILELTGAVDPRLMHDQYLDSMDIERERGITIKAQNVRVTWKGSVLNLIDTPGHVDFSYEVSRSLAACEGAVLLVDASQGMQAQTLATCYQAMEHDLEIVPVLNKIDLPAADPERCVGELESFLGIDRSTILLVSAKSGKGVPELLDVIVARVPAPKANLDAPVRVLVFDSAYDQYRGVVSSIRVVDGILVPQMKVLALNTGKAYELQELGVRIPGPTPVAELGPGEVGYVITGLKNVRELRTGETLTSAAAPARKALAGYREPKPMVFCGLYPIDGDELPVLRESLEKLQLSDASFVFQPESSGALGFGFRCGFLGLLHMDIVKERLEREFGLDLVASTPSVRYVAHLAGSVEVAFENPAEIPERGRIESIDEPVVRATLIVPAEYIGQVMELCQSRRGEQLSMEYLSSERLEMVYTIPLAEVVVDFFDQLKSRTKGYASMDYEPAGYKGADLVRVEVLLNHAPVDAFSAILHRSSAEVYGRRIVQKLAELIPRQLFDVPIQAAVGSRIIARETIKARRKDVIAKCYGGDITRKRKLLAKQKEGKKRMKAIGSVEVPQEAFISVLRIGDS